MARTSGTTSNGIEAIASNRESVKRMHELPSFNLVSLSLNTHQACDAAPMLGFVHYRHTIP